MNELIKVGDRIIRVDWFSYTTLVVTSRTKNTIATSHLNGSTSDLRAPLRNFRGYDEAKAERLTQIKSHINELKSEARELYESLPALC